MSSHRPKNCIFLLRCRCQTGNRAAYLSFKIIIIVKTTVSACQHLQKSPKSHFSRPRTGTNISHFPPSGPIFVPRLPLKCSLRGYYDKSAVQKFTSSLLCRYPSSSSSLPACMRKIALLSHIKRSNIHAITYL